ncbi:hypothetical protein RND81_08G191700 [Saponaria officinalis]|uniref:RRM domain-containing protein n=1 Tax=Saponaria officinalis TaxID=3572 RepID=A0AAW1J978_SAPOF
MSQHMYRPNDFPGSSIDPMTRDGVPLHSRTYGYDDFSGLGVRPEPNLSGLTSGVSKRSYASLEDPIMISQKRGGSSGISPLPSVNPDVAYERPDSERRVNGLSLPPTESNILFVDGLPTNCTRREVGHIFRPFIGFKDIKVIHKEPRRSGDKATVLCFVEFNDPKCALTAMDALQGYKFDDKKPETSTLRLHFAHFPFRLPAEHVDRR